MERVMPTHETNTEFIERIMNFCPHGALIQAFVLEALNQYAEQVADPQVHVPDTPMLSGQSWKQTAIWLQGQLEQHLKT
jgi:hypothetical protein